MPILIDGRSTAGRASWSCRRIATAFYYVLDRETGEFVRGTRSPSRHGRRARRQGTADSTAGDGPVGGRHDCVSWTGRRDQLVQSFVQPGDRTLLPSGARGLRADFLQGEDAVRSQASTSRAAIRATMPGIEHRGVVKAVDAATGTRSGGNSICMRRRTPACCPRPAISCSAARAREASSRSTRRRGAAVAVQTGAPISADPMSFEVDGRQHVGIVGGAGVVRVRDQAVTPRWRPRRAMIDSLSLAMKLATFEISTPAGPLRRLGAALDHRLVDLAASYAAHLERRDPGCDAGRVGSLLFPPDMTLFLGSGMLGLGAAERRLTRRGPRRGMGARTRYATRRDPAARAGRHGRACCAIS